MWAGSLSRPDCMLNRKYCQQIGRRLSEFRAVIAAIPPTWCITVDRLTSTRGMLGQQCAWVPRTARTPEWGCHGAGVFPKPSFRLVNCCA